MLAMTNTQPITLPPLSGWALVLGASSGFGAASAKMLARAGVDIIGVHLDRRAAMPEVQKTVDEIQAMGREAWFYNGNAGSEELRCRVLDEVRTRFEQRGKQERVRVVLHSLAFGSLARYFGQTPNDQATLKQLEMTLDVMAHSLVFWVQDLLRRDLLSLEGRIFAMTSTGSQRVWDGYGAVSAAKAALESHIRQIARELGPRGITANAVCAGVTDTPAARKIPSWSTMSRAAQAQNPHKRLTRPEDVAAALVALAQPCTYWMNGNTIYVDGGEGHCGPETFLEA
jgi:NAD(P)-dependent dehydrogenase (short-subunit alcohol dehydrogenase family)